jgi:uncharacterized protein
MLLVSTYVAPSQIEGVGVFAAERIPAGRLIWKLDPGFDRLVGRDSVLELEPAMRAFIQRYAYPLMADPSLLVVELDNGRFMNHSATPNTRFDDPDAGYATVDIAAGDEILCDYGEFDPGFEMLPGRHFIGLDPIGAREPFPEGPLAAE